MSRTEQQVYELFRNTPSAGESSYLYDHYKRGLQKIMEPGKDRPFAHAAWRAGRDTANFMTAQ